MNSISSTDAKPTKFANLSELANARLSSSTLNKSTNDENQTPSITIPQRTKFFIPKLSGGSTSSLSPSSSDALTPHEMSLKKIMDLKRLHLSSESIDTEPNVASENISRKDQICLVDLTAALNKPSASHLIVMPEKKVVEEIDYKFIDCDIVDTSAKNMPVVTRDCCLDISNILTEPLKNRTKITSPFGKILCSRFKCKTIPYIRHGFDHKHQIQPFRFDVEIKLKKK